MRVDDVLTARAYISVIHWFINNLSCVFRANAGRLARNMMSIHRRVSRRLAETSVASAASRRGSITFRHLLDDDLTLHAGTLVRLAVELVGTSLVELVAHLFAGPFK